MNATRFTFIPYEDFDAVVSYFAQRRGERTAEGCVLWRGTIDRDGYGKVRLAKSLQTTSRVTSAHRLAFIIEKGPIADGFAVIDHLCRNRSCVNSEHLELVSNKENCHRGAMMIENREKFGLPKIRTNKQYRKRDRRDRTHCKWGHEWSDENVTVRVTKDGYTQKSCKICMRDRHREWRARQVA